MDICNGLGAPIPNRHSVPRLQARRVGVSFCNQGRGAPGVLRSMTSTKLWVRPDSFFTDDLQVHKLTGQEVRQKTGGERSVRVPV